MKKVTAILIGAGLRGARTYSAYGLEHPEELKIVAVAEPDPVRRENFAKAHGIPEELQFDSYEELLGKEKMADCALVCTQDTMHFAPAAMALEKGYHVLCEKPMATTAGEILEMGRLAEKYGRILSICHVLRYSPFFSKIKSLLEGGSIGRLISIAHIEQVGFWHNAHSFVRGNWRNAELSSPMILAKSCHDMDILLWLADSTCERVSSFGSRSFFRKENMPEGAPERCVEGCPHRDTCEFYAPRFYLEDPRGRDGFVYALTEDPSPASVMEALRTGPYGRCVFRCDNTVVDHQVVNLEFANQVTASFTMCAFTDVCAREIHLMGTQGEIRGDMEKGEIEVIHFLDGTRENITLPAPTSGHGGSDSRMMKDFVKLIAADGKITGKTLASVSMESHLMALAAEQSRVTGKTVEMKAFKEGIRA